MAFDESLLESCQKFVEWIEYLIGHRAPKTLKVLEQVAVEEWMNIQVETCANPLNIYRKRLSEVVNMKYHAIDYLILLFCDCFISVRNILSVLLLVKLSVLFVSKHTFLLKLIILFLFTYLLNYRKLELHKSQFS